MTFPIALAMALVLTPLAAALGRALGLVDRPGELKIHRREVPVTGGLAVAGAVLLGAAALGERVPLEIAGAAALLLLMGLADDLRPLPPWLRLNVQALAGVLVALALPPGPLGAVGIVFVVAACANALNMIDGQDGLAAGAAVPAALGLAGAAAVLGAPAVPVALGLAGALTGFLWWNRAPARVFLGNGGAYAVGLLLAVPAVVLVGTAGWRGTIAAGVCLGVLVFELVFSVGRRLWARAGLAAGDRAHSYDLIAARVGRRRSTAIVAAAGAATALAGVGVAALPAAPAIAIAGGASAAGLALGVWLWGAAGIRRRRDETYGSRRVPSDETGRMVST